MPDKIRILLVDDHPFVRDGVRMRLEATGQIVVVGEADCVEDAANLATRLKGEKSARHRADRHQHALLSGIDLTAQFGQQFP